MKDDDQKLWDFITQGIKPLTGRIPPATKKPKQNTPAQKAASGPIRDMLWQPDIRLAPLPEHARPQPGGIDRNTAERLRKGKMPLDGILDLHGVHQNEAHTQLQRFILSGHQTGHRCLLVITGKGSRGEESGVLRRMLPFWLAQSPLAEKILMHSPAQPKDGGSGAFYILLRRSREAR